jgi:monofunctional glycosyltransferase
MVEAAAKQTAGSRRRLGRGIRRAVLAIALAVVCAVVVLRWINPPPTLLMASEWWRLGRIEREWIPLERMTPALPLAAVAAEDANFCLHRGFDLDGIREALSDSRRLRGASTISQQVAKNVFLWPERSWLRKGLEAGFTVMIELAWPKARVVEVYLNVAEFDEGVFGVEAAARRYFGVGAEAVTPMQAARLMAVLPDPKRRSPVSGTAFIRDRGNAIARGAETIRADGRASCLL